MKLNREVKYFGKIESSRYSYYVRFIYLEVLKQGSTKVNPYIFLMMVYKKGVSFNFKYLILIRLRIVEKIMKKRETLLVVA